MEVQTKIYTMEFLQLLTDLDDLIDSFWLVGTPFVIAFFFLD